MRNRTLFIALYLLTAGTTVAQSQIFKPAYLRCRMDSTTKSRIFISLDTLFAQIKTGKLEPSLICKENSELSISTIKSFSGIEESKRDSNANFYKKQLINIYPISANEYWISIAFIGYKNSEGPILKNILSLIATNVDNHVEFSIPTKYLTKTWKTTVVGDITYFYREKINLIRAKKFNDKNIDIATKLGLKPEKLNFYLCNNYQEILQLLGYEYDMDSNGKTRDGYGVDSKTIFSVMNNEDFSHDIFHFYSAKIRGDVKRNSTTEEGIAYSWGNAYYTKADGEMVYQKELIQNLRVYLKENPKTSLLELFNKNTRIFDKLPPEIAVKSSISSLLCDEVERKKGIEGVKALIKCGRGDENFFRVLNDLITINQANFDTEVMKLIEQYRM